MMKLLDKLLLLLLIAIINYPSASLATSNICRVSNHCIGYDGCGWTLYGYRKSCCVNNRCSCKESIWDSVYCPEFEINTVTDFNILCGCFPNGCYYKDDTDRMIMKCLSFIGLNYSKRDELVSNDPGWWNTKILWPPIHN